MEQGKYDILMLEDEPAHAELVKRSFEKSADRFRLSIVETLAEARRRLEERRPDLIIADLFLPDGLGIEVLSLNQPSQPIPVVVMTSQGDERAAVKAMKAGALDYIPKSADLLTDMPHIVERALREWDHITERKRAEASLEEERERLAVTLRSIGDGVITTDAVGRITMMNRVAEKLTGWTQEEANGKPLETVFKIINEITREPCENPVAKVLETGGIVGLANNTVLIGKNGTELVIADSGAPIIDKNKNVLGVVLVFRDVTDNRRMEKELLRTQKLESLGVLAGGIAHDFNNAMMAIIGNVSLAKLYTRPGNKISEKLEEIEKAALRTKDLTQQLLTFAKGGTPVKQTVNLSVLIKDTAAFSMGGSNVQGRFDIQEDLWTAEADVGQISQVINNIILNADQSMPEGGFIDIRAENVSLETSAKAPLAPGKYVKISFYDQGVGIPREHLSKIFDPYFTTKQKGSGLGLAVAHSIIEKHEGCITAESELYKGSSFHVYLPASDSPPEKEEVSHGPLAHGKEKILLMDDDTHVRKVGREMLLALGYKVECARGGDEALQLYKNALEAGKGFDAAILDLTVPGGMGGKETFEKIIEIDPQALGIVSSGYSNDHVLSQYEKYGFRGAVAKPYRIQELSETLKTALRKRKGKRKE